MESFIGKFRDEWRNGEVFWSGEHAQVIVERWRRWYNEERPHSALGYQTPVAVAGGAAGWGDGDRSPTGPHLPNPDGDGTVHV